MLIGKRKTNPFSWNYMFCQPKRSRVLSKTEKEMASPKVGVRGIEKWENMRK